MRFRLDAEQEQRLNALVARTGRSKEFHVQQALDAYLDDIVLDDIELAE